MESTHSWPFISLLHDMNCWKFYSKQFFATVKSHWTEKYVFVLLQLTCDPTNSITQRIRISMYFSPFLRFCFSFWKMNKMTKVTSLWLLHPRSFTETWWEKIFLLLFSFVLIKISLYFYVPSLLSFYFKTHSKQNLFFLLSHFSN